MSARADREVENEVAQVDRSRTTTRVPRNDASSTAWVTKTNVLPVCARCRGSSTWSRSRVIASRAPKGSSMSTIAGLRQRPRDRDSAAASHRRARTADGPRHRCRPTSSRYTSAIPRRSARPQAREARAELEFPHAQPREEVGAWSTSAAIRAGPLTACSVDGDRARGGSEKPAKQAQERRLAAARRADERRTRLARTRDRPGRAAATSPLRALVTSVTTAGPEHPGPESRADHRRRRATSGHAPATPATKTFGCPAWNTLVAGTASIFPGFQELRRAVAGSPPARPAPGLPRYFARGLLHASSQTSSFAWASASAGRQVELPRRWTGRELSGWCGRA